MKRIMIIGNCGAGKSRFAILLSKKLHIEVIHLDKLYWKEGWIRTPKDEWEKIQKKLVRNPTWIIDGNYRSTMDIRFAAADTIIFLDFPKWLCLYRAIKRRITHRHIPRPDIPQELQERISYGFIKWILFYPRNEVYEAIEKYKAKKKIKIFRTPKDLQLFIDQI